MGLFSFGSSKSKSSSSSQQSSFVDPNQQKFLEQIFGGAADTFQNVNPGLGQAATQLGAQLGGRSEGFLDSLQQQASGGNPFVGQQVDALGADIGRFLQTQALPGIGQGFATANQFGGGRQGLAEGQAITGALSEFASGAADIRSRGFGQQTQAALGGLGQLQDQFNLGLSPFLAQFAGLDAFADLIGDPTVLQQGTSTSSASSSSFNLGFGG